MKQVKTAVFIFAGVVAIMSCQIENKNQNDEQKETEIITIEEPEVEVQSKFQKNLTYKHIEFDINSVNEGATSQLSIQPKGLEDENEKRTRKIEGQVSDAVVTDLDADGYPELFLYTYAGEESEYGNVIAYSVNQGKSMSQVYMAPLSEHKEASMGYNGQDEFTIHDNRLVRTFPVFSDTDESSKIRKIEYKLVHGEASKQLVIDKMSDLKHYNQ